jgi:hypothetical protein
MDNPPPYSGNDNTFFRPEEGDFTFLIAPYDIGPASVSGAKFSGFVFELFLLSTFTLKPWD